MKHHNIYWKVKKENLKYVPNITQEQVNIWSIICSEPDENKNQYIYISIIDNYLGYMPYFDSFDSDSSVRFYEMINCEYMGEIGVKKERREKLIKIYSL